MGRQRWHGDWYVVDREAGTAATWVGFKAKKDAQTAADTRNERTASDQR